MRAAWRSWALSHAGAVRSANEDSFVDRPEAGLWMVADGAGGHDHGEVASGLLAEALGSTDGLAGSDLIAQIRASVARTHHDLRARAAAEGAAVMIASTIVVFLASGPHYACLWAGDSRIYRLHAGQLVQLTRDHSLVQALIDQGAISEADAEHHPHANIITRAVGADGPEPELDKITDRAEAGDRFLLCSDGLNKVLNDRTIARLVAAADPARRLIEAALEVGARDNVTAIVVEYGPSDDEATMLRRPPG